MLGYLLGFCYLLWLHLFPGWPCGAHRQREMYFIARDILTTDAGPLEALTLENIVGMESGWERTAIGKAGELGAFQLMPNPNTTDAERTEWKHHGAREALRRLRTQGIQGYVGCVTVTERCARMIENRTLQAKLYFWAFSLPNDHASGSVGGGPGSTNGTGEAAGASL